jgi:hypothetical protein
MSANIHDREHALVQAPKKNEELQLTIALLNIFTIVQMVANPYFAWGVGMNVSVKIAFNRTFRHDGLFKVCTRECTTFCSLSGSTAIGFHFYFSFVKTPRRSARPPGCGVVY